MISPGAYGSRQVFWESGMAADDGIDGDDVVHSQIDDTPAVRALRIRLHELREEHRALDSAIAALMAQTGSDAIQVARLKKRKLALRDQITWVEDQLRPDIIA
jgi:hypothetical protein